MEQLLAADAVGGFVEGRPHGVHLRADLCKPVPPCLDDRQPMLLEHLGLFGKRALELDDGKPVARLDSAGDHEEPHASVVRGALEHAVDVLGGVGPSEFVADPLELGQGVREGCPRCLGAGGNLGPGRVAKRSGAISDGGRLVKLEDDAHEIGEHAVFLIL